MSLQCPIATHGSAAATFHRHSAPLVLAPQAPPQLLLYESSTTSCLASFSFPMRTVDRSDWSHPMGLPATTHSASSCPPPSCQAGACSLHHTPRSRRIHRAPRSHPHSMFSPPPVPCSSTAPFSVSALSHCCLLNRPVPNAFPFSSEATETTEADHHPPELPPRR
jgi:hypothetical protein